MANIVVIGASGDVGRGIVEVLVSRGHAVAALARTASRVAALADELGRPASLHAMHGSLDSEAQAQAALGAVRAIFPGIDAVIVSVNGPREPAALLTNSPEQLAARLQADLVAHYTAARIFMPALAPGGVHLGIGGGSADFILQGGVPQSIAQAGLRMLYRGLAHECAQQPVEIRQLIIASIVNGSSMRGRADPLWVTDREIGAQVAAIVDDPGAFPGPILRLARRDDSGRPVFSSEGPSKVQGFR
ncbi:SDR family NAD(P)-dependent oxidoreductase [Massilia cavernae]|uniref:SDR family oxidoreductase n=1 Tax=Massilia cavernae TaxID=2320864 RepID=A0A418Y4S4_9BURK|nr:SDR family NAD(P)-dependent oxidoreductase [Massilia cavernae]RJG20977.1 SDR family oxidoreductase [Massilia cavernae]